MFETTNQFRSCANSNVASFVRFHSPNSSKLACHPVNQLIRNEDSSSCHEHIVIEITMVFTSFFISGEMSGTHLVQSGGVNGRVCRILHSGVTESQEFSRDMLHDVRCGSLCSLLGKLQKMATQFYLFFSCYPLVI